MALRCRNLEMSGVFREVIRTAHSGIRSLIVEHENAVRQFHTAAQDIPRTEDMLGTLYRAGIWIATGRNNDDVRVEPFDHCHVGGVAQPHIDTGLLALCFKPLWNG